MKTDSKLNITAYGENFYKIKFKICRVTFFKSFFYRKEIMGWTSGFPEITKTLSAHLFKMNCSKDSDQSAHLQSDQSLLGILYIAKDPLLLHMDSEYCSLCRRTG